MRQIEKTAKTYEEALESALEELNASISEVDVLTLEEGSKGLFGLFGSRPYKIRVTLKGGESAAEDELDVKSLLAPEKPAKKAEPKPEKQPEKKAAPAPEKKRTEAELIKTAKFGEKIVPASAKAAEKAPEPEAKPAPAQQAKRSMPEAETLKKFAFGEKTTPKKEG